MKDTLVSFHERMRPENHWPGKSSISLIIRWVPKPRRAIKLVHVNLPNAPDHQRILLVPVFAFAFVMPAMRRG